MSGPVQLDLSLCKACGICIELCPERVFDRDSLGEPVVARPQDCNQCLICELHCPDFAIEVRRRERKGRDVADVEDLPALTREDLVAATKLAADEQPCRAHDGEES